jgi:succinate dehydrogenase / fumarate reductase iron-sulfur subunit
LKEPVVLRPLPGFPVIRDLIVDMTRFYRQYHSVRPWVVPKGPLPERERLQSPEDREALNGLYECILCACCSSSCPSYWWNPERFLGPAALIQASRFIADTRDDVTEERVDELNDAYKLFRCRVIMNCADVCPKGLNPAAAIEGIRQVLMHRSV